jgi:alpha,alpha-trehalase
MKITPLLTLLVFVFFWNCKQATKESAPVVDQKARLSPDERFGQLFADVQMARIFPDGKTFVDGTPKFSTDEILQNYAAAKNQPNFDLKAFVNQHFEEPNNYAATEHFKTDLSRTPEQHIRVLWDVLTRQPDTATRGSLILLPKSYIVPGGRFREVYYWDSYFTMLGLQVSNRADLIQNMVDNFAYLLDTVGFIPNGNRLYYLSRSQPPFFAGMVSILAEMKGDNIYKKYLPALQQEYDFWMADAYKLTIANPMSRRVVRLDDSTLLNRYWDDKTTPRPESYREDVETAAKTDRPKAEVYRHLRAGAESGWDFSSRWFKDGKTLSTIHTTDIVPVDLNALMYNLEKTLEKTYQLNQDTTNARRFADLAERRRRAVIRYCWNTQNGYFEDYDFVVNRQTDILSLAGMYPLFFQMADPVQATRAAKVIEQKFLKSGGVVSTLDNTGQQWDAPNGWAPLQWITIQGLRNYQQNDLANLIKQRWTALNTKVYQNTGKMLEKYNVMDLTLEAGGGEYPVQDGFGWTNGVLLKLLSEKN